MKLKAYIGITEYNNIQSKRNSKIDYIFWILLIIFTDPGGIVEALNIFYVSGKILYKDVVFLILCICYFIIPKTHSISDGAFGKVKRYLIIFISYFYIFYVFIVPNLNHNENYTVISSIIKTRHAFYNFAIFFYIYEFFKRRWDIFLRVFLVSSIIVLILFVQARMTGINILPVNIMNRKFVNIDRNLMISEGIMPLLIPLGIVVLVFKTNTKFRYMIVAGFLLMVAAYLFELWRRNFIALAAFFFLAVVIDSFIRSNLNKLISNSLKAVVLLFIMVMSLYFISPKYTKAAQIALVETVSVVKESKTSGGESDVRLGLNRPFINNLFYKNPLFGTGFDNRWRNHEGDLQGYEAADYPFLAALAMFGIMGILVFGPVYILLIKLIRSDLKYFRTHKSDRNIMQLLSLSFIIFFIYHLVQYFNYFIFISVTDDFINYFFLSLYLSSRGKYYSAEIQDMNLAVL